MSSRRRKGTSSGSRRAGWILLVLIVATIGAYLFLAPSSDRKTSPPQTPPVAQQPSASYPPASANLPAPQTPAAPPPATSPPATGGGEPPLQDTAVPDKANVPTRPGAKAQLAIIIDDMGSSMQEARSLKNIGVPINFAIIPGLRVCRDVAIFAAEAGIETMLHIPMQSKGWPQRKLEPNGLLVSMEDDDIRSRMEEYFRLVPGTVGANNHMGSEYTEREDRMRVVVDVLRKHGMFFIDSVTSPDTVGIKVARDMGVRSSRRHVFLDNEQNQGYINGQLQQAVRQAKKNGGAIAIGHPHPATIAALAHALPLLKEQGVTLVPVSRLVH